MERLTMLNTMIVLKMKNCTYDDWKKAFDVDAEMQAEFMRETIVDKVDEQTAIVSADVFAPEKMQQLMSAPEFKQLEEEMGLEHAVYFLQRIYLILRSYINSFLNILKPPCKEELYTICLYSCQAI